MKKSLAALPPDPISILLVDDNCHGLVARQTILEELGYRVATASSGERALEVFSREHFDLVVTDFRMPGIDGAELIRRIRELAPATKLILLSGFVEPLGLSEQSTGADVVIAKCANEIGHLVRSVKRLLGQRIAKKPPASLTKYPKSKAQGV